MKRHTLMKSTQVAVVLAVNVITRKDGDARLTTLPLIALTPILFWAWATGQWCTRQGEDLSDLAAAMLDLVNALGMAAAPYWWGVCILGKSLAFGMGVRV